MKEREPTPRMSDIAERLRRACESDTDRCRFHRHAAADIAYLLLTLGHEALLQPEWTAR